MSEKRGRAANSANSPLPLDVAAIPGDLRPGTKANSGSSPPLLAETGTRGLVPGSGGSADGATSLSLLEQARNLDPRAWERLVALYEPLVNVWCRQAGLVPAEIDDARQEVFLAVSQSLGRFERRQEGSFRCWLKSVARTKAIDVLRRRGSDWAEGGSDARERLGQLEAERALPGPNASDMAEEVGILYRRAMELIRRDFSEETCVAFLRTAIERRSAVEAAEELGISANAVRLAKSRVLQRLRTEFAGLIET